MASFKKQVERRAASAVDDLAKSLFAGTPLSDGSTSGGSGTCDVNLEPVVRLCGSIKSEVRHIEKMLSSIINGPDQYEPDEETESIKDKLVQVYEEKIKPMLQDTFGDVFPGIADNILQWLLTMAFAGGKAAAPTILSLLHLVLQTEELRKLRFEELQKSGKIQALQEASGAQVAEMATNTLAKSDELMEQISEVSDGVQQIQAILDGFVNAGVDDVAVGIILARIDDAIRSIENNYDALTSYHNADTVWFQTIYDKIVECCAIAKLEEISQVLLNQNQTLDQILDALKDGGTPATQSKEMAVMTGIKQLQTQLFEIRRLL